MKIVFIVLLTCLTEIKIKHERYSSSSLSHFAPVTHVGSS